ncbi:sensor histidine kinase [Labrys monachus]|uniref:histidine kinase n=1 Tax=Labrys monachus TaxID=217067 RepID=A0ABU0F858_9HYPH|nr:CHASE3 domain-containing protein [Labrys monachus]MDQ0390803.1 signal transduction histidine kinase [Labrys monachus]
MPISKVTFVRSTVLLILLGLAALVLIVAATFWLVGQTQAYSDKVTNARRERAAVVDLVRLVQEAETGQRGYLLTGDENYLKPYENARRDLEPQLARVRSYLNGEADIEGIVDRLNDVLTRKLDELRRTIDLQKAGRHEDAIAIVRTDVGQNLMDAAQDLFQRLIETTDSNVRQSLDQQRDNISYLRWVTLLSALAILLLGGGSVWTVLRYMNQLVAAEREVSALNAGLEERVRERTADFQRANEEIQRFAYIVTHDLRAPLVNIMGFTSELETSLTAIKAYMAQSAPTGEDAVAGAARLAVEEDLPEAIGFIRTSTGKMDGLINAILKLSREGRRTLKPEKIDLGALLQATASSLQHQAIEAGGEVQVDAQVPPIVSDRLALEQVFGNLVDNAVKYSQPGRPLKVRVKARQIRGRRIVIDIEDNGRGIASHDHERVFDLFRRSGAQDQRGEGIGLAHVRVIVRNLGGEITLKSSLGQGTTFTVSLPPDLRDVSGANAT